MLPFTFSIRLIVAHIFIYIFIFLCQYIVHVTLNKEFILFFKSLQVKDLLQSSQIKFEVLELDQQGKKVKVDKAHIQHSIKTLVVCTF